MILQAKKLLIYAFNVEITIYQFWYFTLTQRISPLPKNWTLPIYYYLTYLYRSMIFIFIKLFYQLTLIMMIETMHVRALGRWERVKGFGSGRGSSTTVFEFS